MNLRHLTDQVLLDETKRLAHQERLMLPLILHHLIEIDRRRLFTRKNSLHKYVCNELKYATDQAYRRIAAMRILRELPVIEEWLASGDLNVTLLNVAKFLFNQRLKDGKAMSRADKLGVIEAIKGKSSRDAEILVQEMNGGAPRTKEMIKPLGHGRFCLIVEISAEDVANLETLRGRLAHKYPMLALGELVGHLAELGIEYFDKGREPERPRGEDTQASRRREVWRRDGGRCVQCGSTHAVEIDHIHPKAMGGPDTVENMRLLCRACNQRAAVEMYGAGKMEPYIAPS